MWKQYTRESPAKRGWAVGGMVIAFAATLALAQWTVGHRKVSYRQELEGWPIAFTLPKSGYWVKAPHSRLLDGGTRKYEAFYMGHSDDSDQWWLIVSCDPESEGPVLSEVLVKGFKTLVGEAQPIRIGPLRGVLSFQRGDEGELMIEAVANDGDRFEVDLILYGVGNRSDMTQLMREICESVEFTSGKKGRK